jgi:hypothetical protein|tara:strand:+ start:1647 stop:2378 length:732 start_codon:yes stop_codon:yes gene_type:complete
MRGILGIFFMMTVGLGYAQSIRVDVGLIRSSTVWQVGFNNNYGFEAFEESKNCVALNIGLDYLNKDRFFLMSGLSFYNSGGSLAVYEQEGVNPNTRWNLKNDNYSIPYLGFFTNANFRLFKQNMASLDAVLGVHVDYIVKQKDDAYQTPVRSGLDNPLQELYKYDAVRSVNLGPNLGLRYSLDFKSFTLGLQYIYSPRLRQVAKYEATDDQINGGEYLIGISVTEKASFTQLTIGYNLKNKKI